MMSYEYELDEWRKATQQLTEVEREINADAHRAAIGLIGDANDDRYGGQR